MRVIVGGIGYRNLRDHSVGVEVSDRLASRCWPEGVEVVVEDLSYNAIAMVQRLEDEPPERRFERAVFVAGVGREDRWPGTVTAYRWDGVLPAPEGVQLAVANAVTGVISLDNSLVVGRHFGALPEEVVVVEVQPLLHEFGEEFSLPVAAVFGDVCELVARLAIDGEAVAKLPLGGLGEGLAARAGLW